MLKYQSVTSSNLKNILDQILGAQNRQDVAIQDVTEYAFTQAEQGQLTPLTDVYNVVVKLRGVNTGLWKKYVSEHVSNVKLSHNKKTDSNTYKKAKKGEAIEVQPVTVLFTDYVQAEKPTKERESDVAMAVHKLFKLLSGASNGEVKIKDNVHQANIDKAMALVMEAERLLDKSLNK